MKQQLKILPSFLVKGKGFFPRKRCLTLTLITFLCNLGFTFTVQAAETTDNASPPTIITPTPAYTEVAFPSTQVVHSPYFNALNLLPEVEKPTPKDLALIYESAALYPSDAAANMRLLGAAIVGKEKTKLGKLSYKEESYRYCDYYHFRFEGVFSPGPTGVKQYTIQFTPKLSEDKEGKNASPFGWGEIITENYVPKNVPGSKKVPHSLQVGLNLGATSSITPGYSYSVEKDVKEVNVTLTSLNKEQALTWTHVLGGKMEKSVYECAMEWVWKVPVPYGTTNRTKNFCLEIGLNRKESKGALEKLKYLFEGKERQEGIFRFSFPFPTAPIHENSTIKFEEVPEVRVEVREDR